ncbi:MAG: sulfite exporter TauE/SafE family protein [Chloroflexi bacterium]|nr:sulfite exporter TauE/SafE family protein [Chloroflexota bacterium]
MASWVLLPLGFVVGTYGTLIGAGGGFVLVPVLLLLYPEERPATITAISLAVVCCNALSGSIAYARERRIDYRSSFLFAAATVPGAVIGALVVNALPRGTFDLIFGLTLVVLALFIILRPAPSPTASPLAQVGLMRRVLIDAHGVRHEFAFSLPLGLALSLVVGFVSSLLGIGGGIIHVPALVQLLHFPVHLATATSHFILAVMAFAGSVVHFLNGELHPGSRLGRTVLLALGVVPGAQLGARLSRRLGGSLIIRLLGVALLAVGVRLLLTVR